MKAFSLLAAVVLAASTVANDFTAGWKGEAPRDEIRPTFSTKPDGGPNKKGSLAIASANVDGEGYWQKTLPIEGGKFYKFSALRRVENVESPRRSALVRIHWRDENGKRIKRDEVGSEAYTKRAAPDAEPEYPSDRDTDSSGWTEV